MVNNETTVAQLIQMGISLESIQSFVDKKLKSGKRKQAREQRKAEKAEVAKKVLEVLNSNPEVKWKTGQLVTDIFGLKKSSDSTQEDERYRVHSLVSSSLKDMSEYGTINKRQMGGNACHTWYQSTLSVPEPEFSVNVIPLADDSGVTITDEEMIDIIYLMEFDIQDEEDDQEFIDQIIKEQD
jgi:hypothetical protein